eukprot:c23815_g1_i1 orf=217-657(+)
MEGFEGILPAMSTIINSPSRSTEDAADGIPWERMKPDQNGKRNSYPESSHVKSLVKKRPEGTTTKKGMIQTCMKAFSPVKCFNPIAVDRSHKRMAEHFYALEAPMDTGQEFDKLSLSNQRYLRNTAVFCNSPLLEQFKGGQATGIN